MTQALSWILPQPKILIVTSYVNVYLKGLGFLLELQWTWNLLFFWLIEVLTEIEEKTFAAMHNVHFWSLPILQSLVIHIVLYMWMMDQSLSRKYIYYNYVSLLIY